MTPTLLLYLAFWAQSSMEQQAASAARQRDSVRVQQASVRRQVKLAPAQNSSFFVLIDGDAALEPRPDCMAIEPFIAQGMVEGAARKAGIDANLLQAVASQESAWRPCAVSVKGAQGLMQLMPATAQELGVRDPFDPAQNLAGGAALLKQLMTRYSGDLNRVLGAYNAGPARVDAAGGIPAIPETMNYVEAILGKLP